MPRQWQSGSAEDREIPLPVQRRIEISAFVGIAIGFRELDRHSDRSSHAPDEFGLGFAFGRITRFVAHCENHSGRSVNRNSVPEKSNSTAVTGPSPCGST